MAAWLRGVGCVPIYNLMEDAATAEISRAQVWQWAKHGAKLDDGRPVTAAFVKGIIKDEVARQGEGKGKFKVAADIFERMMLGGEFSDFLTLPAYDYLD